MLTSDALTEDPQQRFSAVLGFFGAALVQAFCRKMIRGQALSRGWLARPVL